MRARLLAAVAAGMALAMWPGAAPASDPAPTRVLATGWEYGMQLSQLKVYPGRAVIQFRNAGEDDHDLTVQRTDGTIAMTTGVIHPGDVGRIDMWLKKRRRYWFYCSLMDHRQRGMQALLRVRWHRR